MEKAVSNRKKFRAKFRAFNNKAEGTHALLCQSPSAPFFSLNFFGVNTNAVPTSMGDIFHHMSIIHTGMTQESGTVSEDGVCRPDEE